jgi:hypothetical protein
MKAASWRRATSVVYTGRLRTNPDGYNCIERKVCKTRIADTVVIFYWLKLNIEMGEIKPRWKHVLFGVQVFLHAFLSILHTSLTLMPVCYWFMSYSGTVTIYFFLSLKCNVIDINLRSISLRNTLYSFTWRTSFIFPWVYISRHLQKQMNAFIQFCHVTDTRVLSI